MNIDKHVQIYMIGVDGGLRIIPGYLSDGLKQQGWKIINNPKRTYYPEYDRTSPHYKDREEKLNVDSEFLTIEVL